MVIGANEATVELLATSPLMALSLNSLNASSLGGLIAKTMPMKFSQAIIMTILDHESLQDTYPVHSCHSRHRRNKMHVSRYCSATRRV